MLDRMRGNRLNGRIFHNLETFIRGRREKGQTVSAAIQSSLQKLNKAVEKLETAVVSIDSKKAKAGRNAPMPEADLFSAAMPAKQPATANNLNVRQLAQRLDTAIHQVEKILKEGRG